MSYTAHLIGVQLPEVLRAIGTSSKTGDLLVLSSQRSARVSFVCGCVVHASADNVDRLGLRLVNSGYLSSAALHDVLTEQSRTTPVVALSTLLHQQGLVDVDVLERETRAHISDVVREVLLWEEGTLLFEEGANVAPMTILNDGVSVETLLLFASTSTDEASQVLGVDELRADVVAEPDDEKGSRRSPHRR